MMQKLPVLKQKTTLKIIHITLIRKMQPYKSNELLCSK